MGNNMIIFIKRDFNFNWKKHFILLVSILFILTSFVFSYADVITLLDGTIINGKIIMTQKNGDIKVTNYYGTFDVKKELILKIQKTGSPDEDVDIYKKMGKKVDKDAIKRNYDYGQRKWEELFRPGKRKGYFSYINCSLAPSYMATLGAFKEDIPYGMGGFASVVVGMHESLFIDTRADFGYLYYQEGDITVSGIMALVGGMWYMPITKRHRGRLHFSLLPGVTYLNTIMGPTVDSTDVTFTLSSAVGYDYPLNKNIMVFGDFRYLYVYDKEYPLNGIGMEIGVSYRVR